MNNTTRIIVGILLAVFSGGILLPTGIAVIRNHRDVEHPGPIPVRLGLARRTVLSQVNPQQQQVVVQAAATATPVPTLGTWALALFGLLITSFGLQR